MSYPNRSVRAFAPATSANLGPGFDVLGMAIQGLGDTVVARSSRRPGVRISGITGDDGRLSTIAEENTAGIAAIETLRKAGLDIGVELEIGKGMPIGSGLGSSAARPPRRPARGRPWSPARSASGGSRSASTPPTRRKAILSATTGTAMQTAGT